jgi:hypothetical protein
MYTSSVIDQLSEGRLSLMETGHGSFIPMLKIPKFKQTAIDITFPDDPFPAFMVDGVEVDEIYISQFSYPCVARSAPTTSVNLADARTHATALGSGFHLMSAWEWAALVWHFKEYWGKEKGPVMEDSFRSLGSGTFFWRMPAEWWGAWGLTGNLYEYCDGVELRSGKVYGPLENNISNYNTTDALDATLWPELGEVTSHANKPLNESPVIGSPLQMMLLNAALAVNPPLGQTFALDSAGSLILERGGAYHSGEEAGLGNYRFTNPATSTQSDSGFRVAYIAP